MSIVRHTSYNLLGSVIPMVLGIVTVPIYLRLIGDARYGVLAIVWLFLGYFGLFDPGITRAALFHIARLNGEDQARERESVFWTALVVNLGFGLVGGLVLYLAARPLFLTTFKMPPQMRGEVMVSLPWLAASIPLSIVTAMLGGALQARDRFGTYNTIYVLNAFLTQLVPLGVAYWHGPDLAWLIPAVLIARTIGIVPSVLALLRGLPFGVGGRFDRARLRPLFSYGGWVVITNLLSPILDSMDRMLIGSVLNAEAVAFYTVPSNLVSRFSVLPGSLVSSIFPRLSRGNQEDSSRLASDAVTTLSAVMTPIVVAALGGIALFMQVWVGRSFAQHAIPVAIALLVGIWINSLAFVPAAHLNAINRPDLPAKFHAFELVPFLLLLWFGLHFFGLLGAAWAWTLRVAFDAALLFIVAGQTPGWTRVLPGGALVMLAALLTPKTLLSPAMLMELVLLGIALTWSWKVSPVLRSLVQNQVLPVLRRQPAGA